MSFQVDKWRGQVTTQNVPGAYRFVLTILSEMASRDGLVKMTSDLYSEILNATGMDAGDVVQCLHQAQTERRLVIYEPQQQTPSRQGEVIVELQ